MGELYPLFVVCVVPWATRRPGYDGGTSWLRRAGRPAMGSRPWHRGAEVCRSRRALTRCPAVLRPGHPGKVARHAARRDHATACKTLRVVTGLRDAATVEYTTEDDVATTAVPTAHSDPRLNVKLAGFRVLCSRPGWSVRHLFPSPPPLSHSPSFFLIAIVYNAWSEKTETKTETKTKNEITSASYIQHSETKTYAKT